MKVEITTKVEFTGRNSKLLYECREFWEKPLYCKAIFPGWWSLIYYHVKIPAECAGQTWLNKNLSNTPKRPVVEWRKRGSICVFLPPTSDQNVWMFMPTLDLQSLRLTPVTWSIYSCKAHTMRTAPHLSSFAACKVYSWQELFALCSQKYHDQEFRTCLRRVNANMLLRNDLLMRMLHSYIHDFFGGPS